MTTERFLDRAEAADHLTAQGLRISKNTLQKLVTVGGGPTYRRFGKRALYLASELDAWAASKLSAPRASASGKVAA
ncbi:MAG: helix-turn-helix domain-containing protein [Zoogloeaceae bacterium]|nr:helix-turn-helix domain-containing protein [Zoogloeaceae bacterium]